MPAEQPRPYTPALLAAEWGCSTALVYKLLNTGALAGFRLGDLWRIPRGAVEAYQTRTVAPPEGALEAREAHLVGDSGEAQDTATAARLTRLAG